MQVCELFPFLSSFFANFRVLTIFNTINLPICPICISNGIYDCVGKGKVWSKSSQLDSSAFFFLPTQYITLIIIIIIIIIIRTCWSLVHYWKATSSESAILVSNLSSSSQIREHLSKEEKTNGQWSGCHGGRNWKKGEAYFGYWHLPDSSINHNPISPYHNITKIRANIQTIPKYFIANPLSWNSNASKYSSIQVFYKPQYSEVEISLLL